MKISKSVAFCFLLFTTITFAKGQSASTKQNAQDSTRGAEIYFENMAHDFDTIV